MEQIGNCFEWNNCWNKDGEVNRLFLTVLQHRSNIAVKLIMKLTARTNIQGTHLLVFSKYLFALWNTAIMLFQLELD